jgi:hypothetical protein
MVKCDGPWLIPANNTETLARLVRLGFYMIDDGRPDVVDAFLPVGWKSESTRAGSLARDIPGSIRVSLLRHPKAAQLAIFPRYRIQWQDEADMEKAGRWVIVDDQVGVVNPIVFIGELLPSSAARMLAVHYAVAEQTLVGLYPDHADPLAYWEDG